MVKFAKEESKFNGKQNLTDAEMNDQPASSINSKLRTQRTS